MQRQEQFDTRALSHRGQQGHVLRTQIKVCHDFITSPVTDLNTFSRMAGFCWASTQWRPSEPLPRTVDVPTAIFWCARTSRREAQGLHARGVSAVGRDVRSSPCALQPCQTGVAFHDATLVLHPGLQRRRRAC